MTQGPWATLALSSLLSLFAGLAQADSGAAAPQDLQALLAQRFTQDRTGVCVVAARIEKTQVQRARLCAQPRREGVEPGFDSRFEIGSISKTMAAVLAADLIRMGRWSLDDPIAKHLPAGTKLPRQGERQILLRDLLTHSSGLPALPPGFAPSQPANPYADLSEAQLLAALGRVELTVPIGSRVEYSNFAMMLLSLALARSHGGDFERALAGGLFEPLQMHSASISRPGRHEAPEARGHLPSGVETAAWTITPNLAGVGMVRASLDDMVRYAQAQLGLLADVAPELQDSMRMSQQALTPQFAMSWIRMPVPGRPMLVHEGGTGGFSSLIALEPEAGRAVVLLADTALSDLGGLGDVAQVALGLNDRPLMPRRVQAAAPALLQALVGDYVLGGLPLRIWREGTQLMAQAQGQAAFALDQDSRGDFFPRTFSALLTPVWEAGRVDRAIWRQGGGAMELHRQPRTVP